MPDKNGLISRDEFEKCNAKFESYEQKAGRDLACEVCGNIVWRLNSHIVSAVGESSIGLLGSKITLPMVNYICTECGNMKFFSAVMWNMNVERENSEVQDARSDGEV